jgi:1-acyl-sn-glycerol-3-phosphate acyltransferase
VLLYRLLRGLLRAALGVFFRRMEVVGRENVPAEGPVIFCGNHPNSLLDPVLVIATCGRVVHFAAKDVLFRSRFLRFFLDSLGAVPIRRRQDHGGGPVDNDATFEQLFAVLAAGETMGIFPEGLSHDDAHLARLKTGAARVALGAARRGPAPVIVPCGLHYVHRKRFRSSVLVQYGEPIAVDAWGREADERAAAQGLTDEIERRLRALTVNADDWETVRVLDGVRRLYQPPHIRLEDRVELARRFNAVYPEVKDRPEVLGLLARVRQYLERLEDLGLSDRDLLRVPRAGEIAGRLLRQVLLLLVWMPLALLGAPLCFPLVWVIRHVSPRMAPRKDVIGTTKFLSGFLTVLGMYAALVVAAAVLSGAVAALLAFFVLPLSGYAALRVLDRFGQMKRTFAASARLLRFRREVDALRAERAALEAAVVAAVDRHRPADMAPLFPRAVAP